MVSGNTHRDDRLWSPDESPWVRWSALGHLRVNVCTFEWMFLRLSANLVTFMRVDDAVIAFQVFEQKWCISASAIAIWLFKIVFRWFFKDLLVLFGGGWLPWGSDEGRHALHAGLLKSRLLGILLVDELDLQERIQEHSRDGWSGESVWGPHNQIPEGEFYQCPP